MGGDQESPNDIYYLTVRLSYKKAKQVNTIITWVVSKFNEPAEIMSKDSKTMSRLALDIYGRNYKSQRVIIIKEVLECKKLDGLPFALRETKQ